MKAAFLKGVVEERGLTPDQTAHPAGRIAATHRETGVPITVHTNSEHETGRLAWTSTRPRGSTSPRSSSATPGDSNDLDYLRAWPTAAPRSGCDRFGLDRYNPTDRRVATVAALCAEGYADRIVLSHDASCYIDFFAGEAGQAALHAAAPNWHYEHITRDVLPALRERGSPTSRSRR